MRRYVDLDRLMERLGIAHECANCSDKMQAFCDTHPDFGSTCELICEAPVEDVKPIRNGDWLKSRVAGFYACSECGGLYESTFAESMFTNFCPRCGAFMRGKKDYE